MEKNKNFFVGLLLASFVLSVLGGGLVGVGVTTFLATSGDTWQAKIHNLFYPTLTKQSIDNEIIREKEKIRVIDEESAVIDTVAKASPAVVSIVISKDLPVIEKYYSLPNNSRDFFSQFFGYHSAVPHYRQNGTKKQEIGGGTGFLVSDDGYILTNKHVVADDVADYTVIMNDKSEYSAKILAKDQFSDVAVIKIEGNNLPYIELGDSSSLKVGQRVITIGNALAKFNNSVSTGIISGLARNIVAGEQGVFAEELMDVIQTDAAINPGNSGGPLLNSSGQAIGINTAIVQGAQNIGFSLPINSVKSVYESVKKNGRIVRPWLGVRYVLLDKELADKNNLAKDYGALIIHGRTLMDLAVITDSPADKAGLVEGDIILEVNNKKIDLEHPLASIISHLQVGDKVKMKIYHQQKEKNISIKLEEMPQD